MRNMKNSFYPILSLACLLISLLFVCATVADAETVSIPNTFSPGSTISSSQMNANFTALKNGIEQNKAGVACSGYGSSLSSHALTGSVTDIISVSITTPGPGTVFVTGMGSISNVHIYGGSSVTQVYISQISSNGSPSGITWSNSWAWPDGNYRAPFSLQFDQIISSSGTYTYYLTGRLAPSNTESTSIDGGNICALFLPN